MVNQMPITLPPRHYDAKHALLIMAFFGEFVQGGLMFGWNALAIMLKDTNNFTKGCDQGSKAVDINGNDYIWVLLNILGLVLLGLSNSHDFN
ncbi:hypothetical protein WJX84_009378, partial [Apatococcus fuscideae]